MIQFGTVQPSCIHHRSRAPSVSAARNTASVQIGMTQVSTTQVSFPQVCLSQISIPKVRVHQMGSGEACAAQICPGAVGHSPVMPRSGRSWRATVQVDSAAHRSQSQVRHRALVFRVGSLVSQAIDAIVGELSVALCCRHSSSQ